MLTCIGVDPGIANTGIACVSNDGSRYHLLQSVRVRTKASASRGARLSQIQEVFAGVLTNYQVDCIAMERVYHNRNVSSSHSTAAVMGVLEFTAFMHGIPVSVFTPQQVKAAAGVPGAGKETMLRMASRLFRKEGFSHHEADAAFTALVGLQSHHRETLLERRRK